MKQTNWCVLTGPPCSGKTTLLNAIADQGYKVSAEVARRYILELIAHSHNGDIDVDPLERQDKILELEIQREEQLDPDELIFFDRALPDSIAYYKNIGLVPHYAQEAAAWVRYKRIFFLEALPLEHDGVRREDQQTAARLGMQIRDVYEGLGYELVTLPPVSVEERVALVLAHL